jgi:DNA polymerase III delta subunit
MVERIVSSAQEAKSWDLTDPLVQGDERRAVAALQRLLGEGEPAPLLAFMVARAYRQLATAKELIERRASDGEIMRAANIPDWKVRSFRQLAGGYGWDQVRAAYRLMVEADLSVKHGLQDDESALQLLVHELCALSRGGSVEGRAYARSAGSRSG